MEEYPVSLCWETPVLSLQYALCHYHCTVKLCQINFAAFGWNWAESKALHTWELIQLFLSSSANTSFPLAAIHEDISWLWILTVIWLLSQECPWLVEGGFISKEVIYSHQGWGPNYQLTCIIFNFYFSSYQSTLVVSTDCFLNETGAPDSLLGC